MILSVYEYVRAGMSSCGKHALVCMGKLFFFTFYGFSSREGCFLVFGVFHCFIY